MIILTNLLYLSSRIYLEVYCGLLVPTKITLYTPSNFTEMPVADKTGSVRFLETEQVFHRVAKFVKVWQAGVLEHDRGSTHDDEGVVSGGRHSLLQYLLCHKAFAVLPACKSINKVNCDQGCVRVCWRVCARACVCGLHSSEPLQKTCLAP